MKKFKKGNCEFIFGNPEKKIRIANYKLATAREENTSEFWDYITE